MNSFVKAFLYFFIISTIAVPLAVDEQLSNRNIVMLIVIGFGVSCVAALVFFGIIYLIQLSRRDLTLRHFVISLLIAGAIRGVAMYQSLVEIEIREPLALLTRTLSSMVTTLVWVLVFAKIIGEFDRFNDRYSTTLRRRLVDFVTANRARHAEPFTSTSEEIEELQILLSRSLDPLTKQRFSEDDLLRAASQLRTYIREVIRPLSRRIWLNRKSRPRFRRGFLFRSAITRPQFEPMMPALFVTGIALANISTSESLIRGIVAGVVLFVSVLYSFNFLIHINKHESAGAFLNILVLLSPGLFTGAIFFFVNREIFSVDTGLMSWVALPLIFGAGLVAGMLGVVRRGHDELIGVLERTSFSRDVDESSFDDQVSQRLASYLHNTLQSELLALSYQLEQAATDPTSDQASAALEKAHSVIGRSLSEHFKQTQLNPVLRLTKLVKSWTGLIEIELDTDVLEGLELRSQELVVATIEEVISNSFRHGGATKMSAKLRFADFKNIELKIWSNSTLQESSEMGLGQQWVRDHCSSFKSESLDKETILTFVFSPTDVQEP